MLGFKVLLAATTSHFLEPHGLPPTWLMIVAPSGSGKTSRLNILADLPEYHHLSELTPRTFLSGFRGEAGADSPSFLHQVGAKGILSFKDFTTVLSMRHDDRTAVLGQLREIHDGFLTRPTGMGKTLRWPQHGGMGRITVLACCTPAIESYRSTMRSMGDRFVEVWWRTPNAKEVGRAVGRRNKKLDLKPLQRAVMDYLNPAKLVCPDISETNICTIASMAEIVATARTAAQYDVQGYRLLDIDVPESPTRLSECLHSIALCGAAMDRYAEVRVEDVNLARRVAWDSIPPKRRVILRTLRAKPVEVEELKNLTLLSRRPFDRTIEELLALGFIESLFSGGKNMYRLTKEMTSIFEEAGM